MNEHIKKIIEKEGLSILTEKRLIFYLDDFGVFKNQPRSIRHIMLSLIIEGYTRLIINTLYDKNKLSLIYNRFIDITGYKEELVRVVFNLFLEGLGEKNIASKKENKDPQQNHQYDINLGKKECSSSSSLLSRLSSFMIFDDEKNALSSIKPTLSFNSDGTSLIFKFDLPNNCQNNRYLFKYAIYGNNGQKLESDSVTLNKYGPVRRCISEVAKNIDFTSISKIGYCLCVIPSKQESKVIPCAVGTKKQTMMRTIYRSDLNKNVGLTEIKYFSFKIKNTQSKSIDITFFLNNFQEKKCYRFCYIVYGKNGRVLEDSFVDLAINNKPLKMINDCAMGMNSSDIDRIEYYLTGTHRLS